MAHAVGAMPRRRPLPSAFALLRRPHAAAACPAIGASPRRAQRHSPGGLRSSEEPAAAAGAGLLRANVPGEGTRYTGRGLPVAETARLGARTAVARRGRLRAERRAVRRRAQAEAG